MALTVQASFTGGELDPALQERTTLQKYQSGLKTARSISVGKSGRLFSRFARKFILLTKLAARKVKLHSFWQSGLFIEWGHLYVRVFKTDATIVGDIAHTLTEDDLEEVHMITLNDQFMMAFKRGEDTRLLSVDPTAFVSNPWFTFTPVAPTFTSRSIGALTGYQVDYACSVIVGGQESRAGVTIHVTQLLPIAVTEQNTITFQTPSSVGNVTEFRFFRRPAGAGAYGFIGSSTEITTVGPDETASILDFGQAADFTQNPVDLNTALFDDGFVDPDAAKPTTGIIYQQRLLMAYADKIIASRPGFFFNVLRDFPLRSESSLAFRAGTDGFGRILFFIESNGLVVFTTSGVFRHIGLLTPTNLGLDEQGPWVCDHRIAPIAVPGGVLFIDIRSNTVRELIFSEERGSYSANEVSVFSDHLFRQNRVLSWTFHDGAAPVLNVNFFDGTYATFTYEPNQEMRAWTRHDSYKSGTLTKVENLAASKTGLNLDTEVLDVGEVMFVVNVGDALQRELQLTVPRYISADISSADPESDKQESIAFMDSFSSFSTLLNDSLGGSDIFVLALITSEWDEPLTLTCGTSGVFTHAVGTIYRFFSLVDRTVVDLEITAKASNDSVTVQPSSTFPSAQASGFRLYLTQAVFTGMTHLANENVAIVSDGNILASPNNPDYALVAATAGGAVTLPNSALGAIVHIGRPVTADIETLDVDSVEQRPVLVESKTVDKVLVRVHETRSLFVANKFPKTDTVQGMEKLDTKLVDYEEPVPILGNRYDQPKNHRFEVGLPGDWRSQGRIALRQVDPVHFEILSIIPDLDDQKR